MESETVTQTTVVDPLNINKFPKVIKEAQQEIGNLDILICGQCHRVFHFIEQLQEHRSSDDCTGESALKDVNSNETKAQVWAFLLWKASQSIDKNESSWTIYQQWCKLEQSEKEAWVAAGGRLQAFTKLSSAKMQEIRTKTLKSKTDELEEGEIKDPLADTDEPSESEMDTEEDSEKEMMAATKNNGTNDSIDKENGVQKAAVVVKPPQGVPVTEKVCRLAKRTDKNTNVTKECVIERILAKRFNPRKKTYEYLIKWEGYTHEQNTWEPPANMSASQHLIEAFERNLARQKEAKAAAQAALIKQQQKAAQAAAKQAAAGPSGLSSPGGRPQRTSKQKALNQVKQWCGNISDRDDDIGSKRRATSDSDDEISEKRIKSELYSDSEDEWQADESEIDRHTSIPRPKPGQKPIILNGAIKRPTIASDIAKSIGLASPDRSNSSSILQSNAKNVVKILKNQVPNLASGVYIMSKKDGILKLESSPNIIASGNNIVRVQKTGTGQASIIRVAPKLLGTNNSSNNSGTSGGNSTQMRIISKQVSMSSGNNNGTTTSTSQSSSSSSSAATTGGGGGSDGISNTVRLSPGMSRSLTGNQQTNIVTKLKTPIKQAVRVTSAGQKEPLQAHRMQIGTPQLKVVRRGPGGGRSMTAKAISLMDIPEPDTKSDTSEDDFDPFPKDLPPPEPDSPPREFTLDPLTGIILGQAEGEPEPQINATDTDATIVNQDGAGGGGDDDGTDALLVQQQQQQQQTGVTATGTTTTITTTIDPNTGAVVKQEIGKETEQATQGQDMPELMMTSEGLVDASQLNVATTLGGTATATITLPETGEPLMITGEDGVVYQVAGQNEEGQTLLVAQGADGQMYVTAATATTTTEEAQNTVLTLDSAVAEAIDSENVAGIGDGVTGMEPLTVNTTMEEQPDNGEDNSAQVVAQLVKAESPSPGGTRKVVLLLPDGNLLMTEVDAEQYAALELDK